jgi:DNA anti-recombination protein RmuC
MRYINKWSINNTKETKMSEKNLDEQVDKLEAAVDPNTVISIGGYNFTPAKLMVAGAIVSSILGTLYGAFEVYKDYMDMKEAIQTYVAPDLAEFDKRLELITNEMAATKASVVEATNYANEIRNDLKNDMRRTERVVENIERSSKEAQREIDRSITTARVEMRSLQREVDIELRNIRKEMDDKLKKALDNPLANQ